MVDKNESGLWAQGSRCYEQLKVIDDMNDLGSELKALNAMKSSRLWMTWATPGCELNNVDVMDGLGLWMIQTTLDPMSSVI